jgi:hypothetical protein
MDIRYQNWLEKDAAAQTKAAKDAARLEDKRLADIEDARHTAEWLDFSEKSDYARFKGDIDY